MTASLKTKEFEDCRDKDFRTTQWLNAKFAGLGRQRRNKLVDRTVPIPVRLYDDVVLHPPQILLTSKIVKEVQVHLFDRLPIWADLRLMKMCILKMNL